MRVKTREGDGDKRRVRQSTLSRLPFLTRRHPHGSDLGAPEKISPILQALVLEDELHEPLSQPYEFQGVGESSMTSEVCFEG